MSDWRKDEEAGKPEDVSPEAANEDDTANPDSPAPAQAPTWGSPSPPPGESPGESSSGWASPAAATESTPPPPPDTGTGNFAADPNPFQPPSSRPDAPHRSFQLGPLTVADILDTTFQLMKTNWKQLGLAVLVLAVPVGVLSSIVNGASDPDSFSFKSGSLGIFTDYGDTPDDVSGARLAIIGLASFVSVIVTIALQPYVQGAITRLVASSYLGRPMSAADALRGMRKVWPALVGSTILVGLAIMGGLIALIIPALFIWVLFTAVTPIIAIEEEGAFNAMGRSWALMKTRLWPYMGTRILIFIIASLISAAVLVIPVVLAGVFSSLGLGPIAWFIYTIGSVGSQIVVFPITAIACTLIYFDSRVRNEGFDVQLMAARLPESRAPGGA